MCFENFKPRVHSGFLSTVTSKDPSWETSMSTINIIVLKCNISTFHISTLRWEWISTHSGGRLTPLLAFMGWVRIGFDWLWAADVFWTAPKGLFISGFFSASLDWAGGHAAAAGAAIVLAERIGDTPVTFATWTGGREPFGRAPAHKDQQLNWIKIHS